ncbi:hypothetical protein LOTGIDRAFT_172712 [Lottia gigantea]|uniref:Uncharacterized protein n=1 Tax=Lottia gigantea TaxID=225164 RepID=V4AB13_LOTGI|nr:hypothetical protein LOTGIDRAFT_172712 [Lottia gigantea]ESP01189.1 hypothetical protein LOTGIDRAFT_172712 [Lottia gigantea]
MSVVPEDDSPNVPVITLPSISEDAEEEEEHDKTSPLSKNGDDEGNDNDPVGTPLLSRIRSKSLKLSNGDLMSRFEYLTRSMFGGDRTENSTAQQESAAPKKFTPNPNAMRRANSMGSRLHNRYNRSHKLRPCRTLPSLNQANKPTDDSNQLQNLQVEMENTRTSVDNLERKMETLSTEVRRVSTNMENLLKVLNNSGRLLLPERPTPTPSPGAQARASFTFDQILSENPNLLGSVTSVNSDISDDKLEEQTQTTIPNMVLSPCCANNSLNFPRGLTQMSSEKLPAHKQPPSLYSQQILSPQNLTSRLSVPQLDLARPPRGNKRPNSFPQSKSANALGQEFPNFRGVQTTLQECSSNSSELPVVSSAATEQKDSEREAFNDMRRKSYPGDTKVKIDIPDSLIVTTEL